MRTRYKQILKSNKKIELFLRYVSVPFLLINWLFCDVKVYLRKKNIFFNSNKEYIKTMKDTHQGERCFIVATGPSLTFEDLELIKDEYSFGMNSSVLGLDKTSWRPSIYGVQDEYVYKKLEEKIARESLERMPEIFVSDNLSKIYDIPQNYKIFPLHYLDHKMPHRKGFGKFKFSNDCSAVVYDGYSITFSLMQLACYMGFSEIYLIGSDCNYKQPKSHFIEYGYKDPHAAVMGDKNINAHAQFKKFSDENGIKVINCTRGGMLEVYPRMDLEEVLSNRMSKIK